MISLPEMDVMVLGALATREEPVSIAELAEELGVDQSRVSAACFMRAEAGQVRVEERPEREFRLGPRGRAMAGNFPERAVVEALAAQDGPVPIGDLAGLTGLDKKEAGQSLRWLQKKGWARKEQGKLVLLEAGRAALRSEGPDERLVAFLAQRHEEGAAGIEESELVAAGIDLPAARALLAGRSGVVDERVRMRRFVSLTNAGRALWESGVQARKQVNQLTSELLVGGGWREVDLRPYDVRLESEPTFPGKSHPLVRVFQKTRRVFFELGFSEIVSPYVESSFWDFDALFQPQDHPAREMQDTFYIARPERCRLPDQEVVEAVRRTHEDGGDTGSVGWGYRWDRDLAARPVLRTHTTATTIRALAENPNPPRKVFCVGPVFRRETVDYKHLPMFHQVDGIIIDENASFATLLGTLRAFYTKMGFRKFQFRPGFFPYTEPSVEVFVWSEKKQDWVEMGGSGMFRPEVTEPFGCKTPVLAWGLGLERLAMFQYDLGSIGELYRARLSWLKETPLCR